MLASSFPNASKTSFRTVKDIVGIGTFVHLTLKQFSLSLSVLFCLLYWPQGLFDMGLDGGLGDQNFIRFNNVNIFCLALCV